MAAAIELRQDFDGAALRRLVRASRDAKQGRRLLALASIYEGGTHGEAARIGGATSSITAAALGTASSSSLGAS